MTGTVFAQDGLSVTVSGDPLPDGLYWRHSDGTYSRCLGLVMPKGCTRWRDAVETIQDQTGSRLVYLADCDRPVDG